jgi:ABC-type transport system involved in multi-copper enzyme maturation permease subunit
MIRFAWLRFRTQAAVALGALVILAVVLAVTGLQLAHAYDTTVATCKQRGDCTAALNAFPPGTDLTLRNLLDTLVTIVPALIGMFWGAPLAAREFETGTFRLAWTQGITRTRWLAVKTGVAGAASMVVAELLSLMLTWWSSPIQKVYMDRLGPAIFHTGGIAPIGYAAFAFALGVTAGALIRRTLPAMAVTLAVFAAAVVVVPLWVRPHLIAPVQTVSALNIASVNGTGSVNGGGLWLQTPPPDIPGAWILSSQITTPAGRPVSSEPATQACGPNTSTQTCDAYIQTLHLRQTVIYQPASRYWPLQWYETAIYLALALALTGFCFWWIRRDRSAELTIRRPRTLQPGVAKRTGALSGR